MRRKSTEPGTKATAPVPRAPRRQRPRPGAAAAPDAAAGRGGGPRPRRWAAALAELRALQAEYEAWRDQLPESLADSRTAELLEGVCDVDLDALDVELPRGFGRD